MKKNLLYNYILLFSLILGTYPHSYGNIKTRAAREKNHLTSIKYGYHYDNSLLLYSEYISDAITKEPSYIAIIAINNHKNSLFFEKLVKKNVAFRINVGFISGQGRSTTTIPNDSASYRDTLNEKKITLFLKYFSINFSSKLYLGQAKHYSLLLGLYTNFLLNAKQKVETVHRRANATPPTQDQDIKALCHPTDKGLFIGLHREFDNGLLLGLQYRKDFQHALVKKKFNKRS